MERKTGQPGVSPSHRFEVTGHQAKPCCIILVHLSQPDSRNKPSKTGKKKIVDKRHVPRGGLFSHALPARSTEIKNHNPEDTQGVFSTGTLPPSVRPGLRVRILHLLAEHHGQVGILVDHEPAFSETAADAPRYLSGTAALSGHINRP